MLAQLSVGIVSRIILSDVRYLRMDQYKYDNVVLHAASYRDDTTVNTSRLANQKIWHDDRIY